MIVGSTSFSFTPLWRLGAVPDELLGRLARAGCGPAFEVDGHQMWRGFPHVAPEDLHSFRTVAEANQLVPVGLVVEIERYRHRHAPLDGAAMLDELRSQFVVARELGVPLVRATPGMPPAVLRGALALAEEFEIGVAVEFQGPTRPDDPAVEAVVDLAEQSGSPLIGLTLDFSLAGPDLPRSLDGALRRLGADEQMITAVRSAWSTEDRRDARLGAGLAVVGAHPNREELANMVASLFFRTTPTGRVEDWIPLFPLVRHAHAKFWDPDPEVIRSSHAAWITALAAAGYQGAVVSEWGGHDLVADDEADAFEVACRHVAMLHDIVATLGNEAVDVDQRGAMS